MFKLTAVLCVGMFLAMLIAGEDRGQLRPGLAAAAAEAALAPKDIQAPAAADVLLAAIPAAAEVAPVAAPVVVEQAAAPVENVIAPVFTLATFDDAPATPAAQADPVDGTIAYVDGQSVNVREGPGKENPVLTKLSRGEAVTVVWQDDTGWSRVRLEGDGLEGYVSTDLLTTTAP